MISVPEVEPAESSSEPNTTLPSDELDASSDPGCFAGMWEVDAIGDADSLQGAGDLNGITLTVGDGEWALIADDATFAGIVDGAVVDATLTGSASGTYAAEGDAITFAIESAEGEATSSLQQVEFADVILAALPPDPFHVACDSAGGAQLLSDTNSVVVLANHQPTGEEVAPPASGPAVSTDCLVGEWNLDSVASSTDPTAVGTVTGVTITFDGEAWTFTAEDATVNGVLGGTAIEAAFDGTASGLYTWSGTSIGVTTETAEGTASPEFGEDATFQDALQALVPAASIDVACDAETATLTAGTSVLTLARLSEPPTDSALSPSEASAPPSTVESVDTTGGLIQIESAAPWADPPTTTDGSHVNSAAFT